MFSRLLRRLMPVALFLLASGPFAPAPAVAESLPYLPGILQPDDHPHGCVDCHILAPDGTDTRLYKMLEGIKGHPVVTDAFKKAIIPDDCLLCHKVGSKLGSLTEIIHKVHFEGKENSRFITVYQGACLNCHSLDLSTGKMSIKHGQANW